MENSHSDGKPPMTAVASGPETITNVSPPPLSSPSNSTCLPVQNPINEPRMTKKRSIAYVDDDDSSDGKKGKRHLPDEEEEEEPYMARDFTKEEKWIYNKVAMESENFDCVDVPYEVFCPGLLYPVHIDQLPDDLLEMYVDMAKLALTGYNKQRDTSFQCVKVIKATTRLAGRMLYHITFQAKDDVAGSTQNFQTTVSNFNGEDRVDLCRFEQKPKPLEGAWAILLSGMCTDP
ncbi:hypothetical protein Vadar_006255 [Vaccinium darrowii]|uniref:Uncharacterized protein n=1 Tax=Vaccinium darrowii TaxID=229202 RepID=A0ACB7XGW5_9ERIC|nr:hypothetical protein Vadar_006255 [Vaccinium darrowii]